MKKELEDNLCEYLGQLIYECDNEFDWMQKETILQKIDAVNILLGTKVEEKRLSWIEKVMDAVKTIKP